MAFDNDTGREVAWNVISFSHLSRSERKRIDAEIQIAKSLDHPRILRFVSAWINREKEEVVFITERVSGGSLRAYIARLDGPLKLKVIKNWCRQILEGIVYLHGQSNPVIHRDLKCDNIFINGNDGKVLIGDLGLSTSLRGAASCATSIVGTPEFMAPELYEEKYGPPVDIYAFGMCLLEMVSRRYPYAECTTPGQIYKKVIASERPQVLSRVKDEALRHLIEVCLDTNPDNRPTAEELLADPYWNLSEDGGDKLAEIEELPETPETKAAPPVRAPRSGVYHTEAETRKQAAAAAAQEESPFRLPVNVLPGPTDDTLILLSSPKSARPLHEQLAKSDVLTYCRRKSIEKVEKVHLIVELTEGKFHNVIFDFNALTDHPLILGTELRDAGLVWEGVSEEELVGQIGKAIMDRIAEIAAASSLSSMGSSADLLDVEAEPVAGIEPVGGTRVSNAGISLVEHPISPLVSPLVLHSVSHAHSHPATRVTPAEHPAATKRPPLAPSPVPRVSVEAVRAPQEDEYVLLSRESCAHLTTPISGSLGEQVPSLLSRGSTVDISGMTALSTSLNIGSASPASSIDGMMGPPRQGSICSTSGDEPMVSGAHFTLANWPSADPPHGSRLPTSEDVKQLQQMLAVVMISERARIASFVPGVYCAFTEDTVRDFQTNNGLEHSGEVDDKTWEILSEQVEFRRRKEEERGHKREEAHKKAKAEQEKKLLQQKRDSEQTMADLMAKMISSIGAPASTRSPTATSNLLADSSFPTTQPPTQPPS